MVKRQYVIKSVCLCMWVKMNIRCWCCYFLFLTTIKSDLCTEISRCCCLLYDARSIVRYTHWIICWPFHRFGRSLPLFLSFFSNGHFSSLIRVSQFWNYNKWLNEMKNIIISTTTIVAETHTHIHSILYEINEYFWFRNFYLWKLHSVSVFLKCRKKSNKELEANNCSTIPNDTRHWCFSKYSYA